MTEQKTWGQFLVQYCGGACLVLVALAGILYVYGWHIDTRFRDRYVRKYMVWKLDRLSESMSKSNGCYIRCMENANKSLLTFQQIIVQGHARDFSPMSGLELEHLEIWDYEDMSGDPFDLNEFHGIKIKSLALVLNNTKIMNLSNLGEMSVEDLTISGCVNTDYSQLKGLALKILMINRSDFSDLSIVKGMPLEEIVIPECPVENLAPLKGMSIKGLNLSKTKVKDLSALKGMPLDCLILENTLVEDLTPLSGMHIELLDISNTQVNDITPVKGNVRLLKYDGTPAKAKELAAKKEEVHK